MADNQEKFYELFDLEEQEAYVLPTPTLKRVSAMMQLHVRSAELSNQVRFHRIKEYGFREMILFEESAVDEDGKPRDGRKFVITDPDLSKMEYVVHAAKLLFPNAPVDQHQDKLNIEAVLEAVSDFLSKAIGPSKTPLSLYEDLLQGGL